MSNWRCGHVQEGIDLQCSEKAICQANIRYGPWWSQVFLCREHLASWTMFARTIAITGSVPIRFLGVELVVYALEGDGPSLLPRDPMDFLAAHTSPTAHTPPDDKPAPTTLTGRTNWSLTCDVCGLEIVRRDGQWVARMPEGTYRSEQDAQRFHRLATDHEHRPG